jgi:hypothetical protein
MEEEDPDAMDAVSLDSSGEIAQRVAPWLDPPVQLPKTENHTQRRLMEPPSRGAASAAVG